MRAHEAGALHADISASGFGRGPAWLQPPADVNVIDPLLWSRTATKVDGVLTVGGVDLRALAAEHGTPAYVLDVADLRARARAFRDGFADYDVFYAGKAFLCTAVVRWLAEEGLNLDVCTGGELTVALRAGLDPGRIAFHGNNKSVAELRRAVDAGVGRIILDSLTEVERLAAITVDRPAREPVGVLVRVTAGVEAHTHEYIATAHEDQKFGLSITAGDAMEAVRRVVATPGLRLLGLHSHIGSQIFDTSGFEVAARRVLALHARIGEELGPQLGTADQGLPELDLGGGFGIAYTTQDDPADPAVLADGMTGIVAHECRALGIPVPRLSIEPGRAIVGPTTCTLYEVGTVKRVGLDAGGVRSYVSVDGGMSDNVRTALYDADYSATLASRVSQAHPLLSRVVGKHCEAGDIVVKDEFLPGDVGPGDLLAVPGTGAYCWSMASNYNHLLRPPVVAVEGGRADVIVRRETEADLLATDVGAWNA
jgi:diaminopimelate decarboxylase